MPTLIKKRGFSLIELLTVITIIGILATISTAYLSSSSAKGRDTKRKADLDAIKKSLELFNSDTAGAARYPYSLIYSLEPHNYIKTLPKDPKTGNNYIYTPYTASGINPCAGATDDSPVDASAGQCSKFTLTACLENNNDTGKYTLAVGASPDGTSCPAGTQRIYQITSN